MPPFIEFCSVTARFGSFTAVDALSFTLDEGETLGLVGESGCGKSTTASLLLGLQTAAEGKILWRGKPLTQLKRAEKKQFRRETQMVFQDTRASLNPKHRIRESIAEPMHNYERLTRREEELRVTALLEDVGLSAADMEKYPRDFSGGQRQRIAIARALALQPKLVILDEATSNLDVSIQAQILNLLRELKQRHAMSYLLISHDLGVVRYMSDRILVMNRGALVEQLSPQHLEAAQNAYTRTLLHSIPDIHNRVPRSGREHTI